MKCDQLSPEFELLSPSPFLSTIDITARQLPNFQFNMSVLPKLENRVYSTGGRLSLLIAGGKTAFLMSFDTKWNSKCTVQIWTLVTHFIYFDNNFGPVGWSCRIHRLPLCRRGKTPPMEVMDETLNNLMVMELWRMKSFHSLSSLSV